MGYSFIEQDIGEVLANFSTHNVFGLDIETTGVNPIDSRILLVQIGFPDHQYVIDAEKVTLSPLIPYLTSYDWTKIIFNAKFEDKFFQHFFNTPIHHVFDCFLAERVINPDNKFGNSFEDLALKYLSVQLDKKVRQSFFGKTTGTFTEKQLKYAAEDVEYLFPLMDIQKKALQEKNLDKVAE
jgi:ribonuclease D